MNFQLKKKEISLNSSKGEEIELFVEFRNLIH